MDIDSLIEVKRNGASFATFVYNGDGARVQSTLNGVVTTFVGNRLEWSGSATTMKKYYYAGSQRVAMRTGSSTLNFLLGDHLGSTSVTTSSTGTSPKYQLYKPFGEVRYTSSALPTKYTFTGQYSNVADFGLMYYNARWVDPVLGRFVQADTIIPNTGNVLDWDRYSYAQNNPVKYNDPSGHAVACPADMCGGDFSPSTILTLGLTPEMGSDYLRYYVAAYPDYNPYLDSLLQNNPAIDPQVAAFLITNAQFQVSVSSGNFDLLATGTGLGLAAIEIGGGISSPDDGVISCPNCGTSDPLLLRSRGAITGKQHIDPVNAGEDGLSLWCKNCGEGVKPGDYWEVRASELQKEAFRINLNPSLAVVPTEQFGGKGHFSAFLDAFGVNGRLLGSVANQIDGFFRSLSKVKIK